MILWDRNQLNFSRISKTEKWSENYNIIRQQMMLTSEYLLCNKVYSIYPERRFGGMFSFWCITFEQFVGSINMALLILNMPCSNCIKYTMKNFLFLTPEIIALDTQKGNKEVRTCISTITLSIFPITPSMFLLCICYFYNPHMPSFALVIFYFLPFWVL